MAGAECCRRAQLTDCCFCFDLRYGAQVLALVYGILILLCFAGSIAVLAILNLEPVYKGTLIAEIVFYPFYFVACILLYIGAAKGRKKLLLPWLIITMIYAIEKCILAVAVLVIYIVDETRSHRTISFTPAPIAAFCFTLYFWNVVFSLYMTLPDAPDAHAAPDAPDRDPTEESRYGPHDDDMIRKL